MTCVCIASKFHVANVNSVHQLLQLVPTPVKALILLFPIRGKLEELTEAEEAVIKEKGQVPIDPTIFWIKQTVRPNPHPLSSQVYSSINARADRKRMRHDRPVACPNKRKVLDTPTASSEIILMARLQAQVVYMPESPITRFIDACLGR
jgi:hypothetical protein